MSCRKVRFAACVVASIILKAKENKKRKKRAVWVREWIAKRRDLGGYNTLIQELRLEDERQLDNFVRMRKEDFDVLLNLVSLKISKKDTRMRKAITASERLVITLRFLASGDSYHSLMYLFRVPVCTLSGIIPTCCRALYDCLKDNYMQVPKTQEQWKEIATLFEELWQFPNCVGALDGKHITLQAPVKSGSYWYNYKGYHSLVLMALVDAELKFTFVDVGCNGRVSDGGVFNNSALCEALAQNSVQLPPPQNLPGRNKPIPYVVVADDAFGLKPYIMKPYPYQGQGAVNRVFNYRLSRARRTVENAFGIIANRFRILRKPIELSPDKASNIVLAICALHNFLISRKSEGYGPKCMLDSDERPGDWRLLGMPGNNLMKMESSGHNYSVDAKSVREEFTEYFVSSLGEIPWQYKHI